MSLSRCHWVPADDPLYVAYHDREWGVPVHDDRLLFEFLILEGAQAGLSWSTILHRRESYRRAFDGFDPFVVAGYDEARISALLQDAGIVRNRLKVSSAVENARCFLEIQQSEGSFDAFLWSYVQGRPRQNGWTDGTQVPAGTDLSKRLSRDLKKRGFRFVGPTICYAFMQAIGMVNDHVTSCFRHRELC